MIYFQPLTEDDLSFLLEIRNDISTRSNLEDSNEFTLEECRNWFNKTNPKWFLIVNEEKEKVGYFRVNGTNVGCDIHPNFRRKGYATNAFKDYLKDKKYADLWVFTDNFALEFYKSLGFMESGEENGVRGRKYIKMEYKIMDKTCLVIPFYLGERRNVPDKYSEDKLIYLKEQIESLEEVNHHLSKVVFIFNLEPGHENILEGYKDKIPKKIQSADVEIVLRKNEGFSYAACTEYITQNIDKYDYFLFTEDDCLFVAEEFDKNLVELFNKYDNCGFLGAIVRDPAPWNNFKKHAGHGTGMMSRDSIKRVWDKFIELSKSNITDYKMGEAMQITFSHCFVEEGMEIYDVRSKYRVPFSTVEPNLDIIYFFSYNNEDLVIPSEIHNNSWFVWNNADSTEFNNYD